MNKREFNKAIKFMLDKDTSGTYWFKVGETESGKTIAVVLGWSDSYDKGETYQKEDNGTLYTLVGKVAFNCDSLQCDYDYDWYLPTDVETGELYDTDSAITEDSYDWLKTESENVLELYTQNILTME